jgi:hypothetical protein
MKELIDHIGEQAIEIYKLKGELATVRRVHDDRMKKLRELCERVVLAGSLQQHCQVQGGRRMEYQAIKRTTIEEIIGGKP